MKIEQLISPLDNRYNDKIADLATNFSESNLNKVRFEIEIEWLIFLCSKGEKNFPALSKANIKNLISLVNKVIILPFGKALTKPSDLLDHKVAKFLQTPSQARTNLGEGQYLTRDPNNTVGMLEQTLEDIITSEPIYEKVCRAVGTKLPFYQLDKIAETGLIAGAITESEAEQLKKTEIGRKAAIDVDDFSPHVLASKLNN